jgi:tetratricopeptide (TPR) repeat protein
LCLLTKRMNEIRAFVGHSFTPDDADVVSTFLRYFTQIQNLLPTFTWTHARAAEPKELAAKVLSLVEDRNVFIGICTKKERVIADDKLEPALLSQSTLKGHIGDFGWKTSDWVVQEIGLAVGRGMAIVLLLENECRKPGGLQGDVEFIPFDRAAPERAFGQLLEMIKALAPPQAQADASSTDGGTEPADTTTAPAEDADHTPDETWDRSKYEMYFAWRLFSGKNDEAEQIDSTYLKTPEAADPEKKAEWQSFTETWRIRAGEEGTLKRLEELKESFPRNVTVLSNLAAAFAHFDHHGEAAQEYLAAAALSESDPRKASSLRASAAVQLHKDGQTLAADECLSRLRESDHADEETRLLYALKEIAESDKDETLITQILERMIDMRPDDIDLRFELAYKYSQLKSNDLSLYHYLQIPFGKRNAMTWNNLGAAFQSSALPAKSIDAYRKAASEGETLAMSNIAYKFMNAGFLKDADAELQKALKLDGYHRNVPEALAQLRDIPEKENSSLEEAQSKARPKVEFVRRVGRALALMAPKELATIWDGPVCKLALSLKDGSFLAVGTYERQSSGLGGVFGSAKATQVTITYKGSVVGSRVVGKVTRKSEGPVAGNSLLGLGIDDAGTDFFLVIEAGGSKLSVMESPTSTLPTFYDITRAAESDAGDAILGTH